MGSGPNMGRQLNCRGLWACFSLVLVYSFWLSKKWNNHSKLSSNLNTACRKETGAVYRNLILRILLRFISHRPTWGQMFIHKLMTDTEGRLPEQKQRTSIPPLCLRTRTILNEKWAEKCPSLVGLLAINNICFIILFTLFSLALLLHPLGKRKRGFPTLFH